MFYLRTARATRNATMIADRYLPAGIYSFTSKAVIPMALQYNADLMFEDTGTKIVVRKYRDREPTEQEIVWIVLQSKFVK
jgi:hypothetical protein